MSLQTTSAARLFDDWLKENPVADRMNWKDAAEMQFKEFAGVETVLGEPLTVVGTHTSKSIKLPVVAFRVKNGWFVLRNNFYGVNVCALWDFPPDVPMKDIYQRIDYSEYLDLIKQKRTSTMSYGGWTGEEMDDPRILRVQVTRENGSTYWSKVSPEEKDRWIARWESTEWYGKDWSSGELIPVGPRRPNGYFDISTVFYKAPHSFAEGISRVVPSEALKPYKPGRSQFILDCRNYKHAIHVMSAIAEAGELDVE